MILQPQRQAALTDLKRAILAINLEAETRFHNFIRKPFLAWKENHLENA